MPELDRYAVFGHPIGHSKSPRIHALFAAQTGQKAFSYDAQDVPAERFDSAVAAFFAAGGKGINCTVPLKELAFARADTCSPRARLSKAVNTLMRQSDGTLYGDNTDGVGLVQDLTVNHRITLNQIAILILGAGGASRGILGPILEERPKVLTIANRTVAKATRLAAEFKALGPVTGCGFADLAGRHYDLIINATAASLSQQVPPLPADILAPAGCCYDLAYGNQPTAFVRFGQQIKARQSLDGLGMLVEQAAEAFYLWRGIRPDTRPVIACLNEERR